MNKILLLVISVLFSFNALAVTNVTFWHMEEFHIELIEFKF